MKQMRVTTTLRSPGNEPVIQPWGPWTDNKAEVISSIASLVASANEDNDVPPSVRPETLDIRVIFRDKPMAASGKEIRADEMMVGQFLRPVGGTGFGKVSAFHIAPSGWVNYYILGVPRGFMVKADTLMEVGSYE